MKLNKLGFLFSVYLEYRDVKLNVKLKIHFSNSKIKPNIQFLNFASKVLASRFCIIQTLLEMNYMW